ncbi:MAG: CDP-diacylglycerol--glycerol-3-phosphate 3-phosphatidyltransferase, partial [bacterium]
IIAISLLIAPLSSTWQTPVLISFWVSVILTVVSGIIYLIPQKVGE